MKKNLFLRLCLMTIALLSLPSCRQDILHEQETYNNSSAFQLTSKRISLDEAQHKDKLLPELQKAKKEVEKQKLNIQGKLVDIGNGIMIDTDEVIYMENGPDFHTYTFSVARENASANAPVENILMSPNTDGSYRVFHIVLNLSEADKTKIANREYVDYKNKQQVTELANINLSSLSQKQICVPHYYSYPMWCKAHQHLPDDASCEYFNKPGAAYWASAVAYDCFGEQYETIMPTPAPIDGGGGGGGGGEGQEPPDDCTSLATDPTQVGLVSPSGCNIGVPTEPNLPYKPIVNLDAGLDPKTKCMLQKMSGDTNLTDDIITLPKNSTTDDLFQKMLRKFNGVDAPQLTFKYDPNLTATSGAYANAKSLDGGVTYQITVGEGLVQSSNIRIMTTLAHELTHVFMLNELFQLGMIEWMPNGEPRVPNSVVDICTTNHEFSGDSEHFFAELLCYYIDHPSPQLTPPQNQIFHDLFGILDNNFKTEAYVHKLAEYVKNSYDWNSESAGWSSAMQTKYGNDWKATVAMNLQMDAIRQTYYFSTWSPNKTPLQFHNEIVAVIDNGHLPNSNNSYPANKNCN